MNGRQLGVVIGAMVSACSGAPQPEQPSLRSAETSSSTAADGLLDLRRQAKIAIKPLPTQTERLDHFGLERDSYPSPAGDLEIWWSGCSGSPSLPVVVWLQSRARGLNRELDSPSGNEMLAKWGHHSVLVVPTLRGQHGNPGNHEYLWGEVEDVVAAVAWAKSRPCVDARRVYLVGQLDGGTLALLAATSGELDVAGVYASRAYLDIGQAVREDWTPLKAATPDEVRYRSAVNFLQYATSPITTIDDYRLAWPSELAEEWMPDRLRSAVLPEGDQPLFDSIFGDALLEVLQGRPWPSDRVLREWHGQRTAFYATDVPSEGSNALSAGCLNGNVDLCDSLSGQAWAWRDGPSPRAFGTLRRACVDNRHAATCAPYAKYVRQTRQSDVDALEPARRLCEQGDAHGCEVVAYLLNFAGFVGEDGEAERLLQRGCELGRLSTCGMLAALAYHSHFGERQFERARKLREKACAGGDGEACSSLGVQYHEGAGVAQNEEKSYELYARACELGSATGCMNASARLEKGRGVVKDERRSFELARKACKLGSVNGCSALGSRYREGVGTVEDLEAAERLYKHACYGGSASACLNLGRDYSNELYGNPTHAKHFYVRAAQKYEIGCFGDKHGRDCVELAELIEDGHYASNDDPAELRERGCTLDKRACED